MKKKRSKRPSKSPTAGFTSKDYGQVMEQFGSLSKALIDSSSIIYTHKAGFFKELLRAVRLYAPQEIIDETGFDGLPISVVSSPGSKRSNDHTLIACALAHKLPVISEDKKVLLSAKHEGIPYFNALMMLHLLLFRKIVDAETHAVYFRALSRFAWYSEQVLAFAKEVYRRMTGTENRSSTETRH